MRALQIHSRGPEVMYLQRLLNKHGADPYVREDGDFGRRTLAAVTAYQRQHSGTGDHGHVDGPMWASLGAVEEIVHPIRGYAQPTDTSCWSASATMMTGTSASIGIGRSRLTRRGELSAALPDVETFVRGMGWRIVNTTSSPSANLLMQCMRHGPAWVAFQGVHFGHAVVLSGMYSDGDSTGTGTVFRVHDPWPPGSGSGTLYGTTYLGGTLWLRSLRPALPAMVAYVAQ